jgi:lipopolysaccharide transport system permease protein
MINVVKQRVAVWPLRLPYYVDVVSALIAREFAIRYKGSLLGVLWAIVSPLAMVAILYAVFTRIIPLNVAHYSSFVFTGLLPWTWFSASVLSGATSLLTNRDLVRKPFFARAVLPVVVVGTNFLLYLLALPVLMGSVLLEGLLPTSALLFLPLVWLVQAIFTLALTMLVAALSVIIRDVRHLLDVVLMLWFYLTPVFYDVRLLPQETGRFFVLNPMAVIVEAHRDILIAGFLPDLMALAGTALTGVLVLLFAYTIFRVFDGAFVEEL